MIDIRITNCNNISSGSVSITEGRLNLKYAVNGTGKSTIAKAIECVAKNDSTALKDLTPYGHIGNVQKEGQPRVEGVPEGLKVAVFNENYVDQYVFREDELLKDSFEVFVKTENYDKRLAEIDELIASVKKTFEDNPELDELLRDMNGFIEAFGSNSRTGIANNSALVRGMSKGNLIHNIPDELEDYSIFLTNENNAKWLKWQTAGRDFIEIGDRCPFCARDLPTPRLEKIERIKEEYDHKVIEHLARILGLFERLGHYFTVETNRDVRQITQSVQGLSDEQRTYLVILKEQVETFYEKLNRIKHIGFDSLKDIEQLAKAIPDYKIDVQYLTCLDSDFTREKVNIINASIDRLYGEVGKLQGAVNRQKREIQETVRRYNTEINEFLRNAGYRYTVSFDETQDHSYKLMLKFGEGDASVSGVKNHLSFGEKNAFALVLFMYHAIHENANLIILDDPISSFDNNKKFAILDMLFIRGGSFQGKTTLLLTHDLEPVIDAIYNHPGFFNATPIAHFMENDDGFLKEIPICKEDILSSIQVAESNIRNNENVVCKLIYLRRKEEIINGKTNVWHLLSSLLHKRQIPTIGKERQMTQEEIQVASDDVRKSILEFDYNKIYELISNRDEMLALYQKVASNYEKLQIYRLLKSPKDENHVIRKFLNETYHVENDYLFQLNPVVFNTVPNFIIEECDKAIEAELSNTKGF